VSARALFLSLAMLSGCATSPLPPGTQVPAERLLASVVPGTTTKAELAAAFGATKTVVFDSGYETWLYQSPAGGGRYAEFVILINPQGVVAKTRQGPVSAPQP